MKTAIDMKRKGGEKKPSISVRLESQPETHATTPTPRTHTSRSPLVYAVLGFTLFLIGAGMSITTLWTRQEIAAAPLVVVSSESTSTPESFTYGVQERLSQPDFFKETLHSFEENKQSFIEADLSNMKIRYYDEGVQVFEANILSKGKEGSWWETPAGLYKIEMKTPNHFSSFGKVYQPWSMVFQGNFFIHGWPYYPDGTAVASQYSGGCIRLADADAEALYALVDVHTPVLVYEHDTEQDEFVYEIPAPVLPVRSYLIADVTNGTILAEQGPSEVVPIASVTKLMTALIATEYINLDKEIVISDNLLVSTSIPRLTYGMKMTAYSLLFPLLLESSNEAAVVYGGMLGTDRFVRLMNEKAKSLGMFDTVFTDTSGADAGNVSTAYDLLRLMRYIQDNRSFLLKISSGKDVSSAYAAYNFGTLSNFNEIPSISGLVGGKVGKTIAAKETGMFVYELEIKDTSRKLAFIVLGAEDVFAEVEDLYAYIQSQYVK